MCLRICGYRENFAKILNSHQKCWLWSSLLLLDILSLAADWTRIVFSANVAILTLWEPSLLWYFSWLLTLFTVSLRLTNMSWTFSTLYIRPRIFAKVHAGIALVYFNAKTTQTKKDLPDNLMSSKDAEDKNPSDSDGHPQTQTETETHIHTSIYIYIYIYIYIWMHIIVLQIIKIIYFLLIDNSI